MGTQSRSHLITLTSRETSVSVQPIDPGIPLRTSDLLNEIVRDLRTIRSAPLGLERDRHQIFRITFREFATH